jgi:crotonobetaine/carnitine-CoA ligase
VALTHDDGGQPLGRATNVDLLRRRAADPLDRPLFRFRADAEIVEWSSLEVLNTAERWAAGLAALGVIPGDRVAVLIPNSAEYLTLTFAIALTGAVEVPVNLEQRGVVLRHVLNDSTPRVIVMSEESANHVDGCGYDGDAIRVIWDHASGATFGQATAFTPVRPLPSDLGTVMYTSGTTGHSKGVMLSHGYMARMAGTFNDLCPGLGRHDVLHFCTPMFHIDSRLVLAGALDLGATVSFAPRFSASGFWDDVIAFEATFFLFVGAMLSILSKTAVPGAADGHHLRIATGAPIPDEAYPYFEDQLGIRLVEVYGLTESVAVTWSTDTRRRRGSAGPAGHSFEVEIVDHDGFPVPSGQSGEIVFRPRGPDLVTLGYWRDQEATVNTLRDLWFHTGDIGRFDDDGFMWFVGRQKDMIRRRGENISAFEVESTMVQMPAVFECAALAVADEVGGEDDILLLVVPSAGAVVEPEQVADYARHNLARFAVPRWIGIVDQLPHTPSGKVAKHLIEPQAPTSYFDSTATQTDRAASRPKA